MPEQGLKLLNLAVIFLSKAVGLPFSWSQKCQQSQKLQAALIYTSCTQSGDCVYEGMNYFFAKMPQMFQKEYFLWEAIFHKKSSTTLHPGMEFQIYIVFFTFLEYFSMLKIDFLAYA